MHTDAAVLSVITAAYLLYGVERLIREKQEDLQRLSAAADIGTISRREGAVRSDTSPEGYAEDGL